MMTKTVRYTVWVDIDYPESPRGGTEKEWLDYYTSVDEIHRSIEDAFNKAPGFVEYNFEGE
jgi:hypothetical protein